MINNQQQPSNKDSSSKTVNTTETTETASTTQNTNVTKDGTASGFIGMRYEMQMCTYLLVYAKIKKIDQFQIRSEAGDADKFDDVLFKREDRCTFFQLKHADDDNKKLSSDAIFNNTFKSGFNLIKYVNSLKNMNEEGNEFKDLTKTAFIFTNKQIDLDRNKNEMKIYNQNLQTTSIDRIKLEKIEENSNSDIINFSDYKEKLKLENDPKFFKFNNDPDIIKILEYQLENFKAEVGNIDETFNIKAVLDCITYAVGQPNELKLREIVKDKLKQHFLLNNELCENFYNSFHLSLQDWCSTKKSIYSEQTEPKEINKNDCEYLFREISNVLLPLENLSTENFIGREADLKEINEKLEQTKWLLITGLAGIGKTELVKKIIENHPVFKNKFIWINAENHTTILNSFKWYLNKLNLHLYRHPLDWIDVVFKYVCEVKLLFVFDNFIKTKESMEYILYIKKKYELKDQVCIFTSRDAKCLDIEMVIENGLENLHNDVEQDEIIPFTIKLNAFKKKDAVKLINKELTTVNYEPDENIVSELATSILCIPKSLKEATNFIKNKQNVNGVKNGEYKIKSYLENSEYLNHLMPLWTATVETMGINEQSDASKVLKYMLKLKDDEKLEKIKLNKLKEKFEDESELEDSILLLINHHVLIFCDAENQAENHEFKIDDLAIKCGRQ